MSSDVEIYHYETEDGKALTKEEIIKNFLEYLAFSYVEINKTKPPKEIIEKWTTRLFNAYENLEVTNIYE